MAALRRFRLAAGSQQRIALISTGEAAAITDIRAFDPVSQLGFEALAEIEVGRATEHTEPLEVTLFEHPLASVVLVKAGSMQRRDRFVALAEDASRRREDSASGSADASRWKSALGNTGPRELGARNAGTAKRFAESRNPLREAARAMKAALSEGERVPLVGAPRDLRFLTRRLAKTDGEATEAACWSAALQAEAGSLLTLPMLVDRGWRAPGVMVVAGADILGSRAVRSGDANATVKLPGTWACGFASSGRLTGTT